MLLGYVSVLVGSPDWTLELSPDSVLASQGDSSLVLMGKHRERTADLGKKL
jgi:hypothetical protein